MASNERVDYSELVTAIKENDRVTTNRLIKELSVRLVDYLKVVMSAEASVAEDCVQEVFIRVLDKIREDKIKKPKTLFSYLIRSSRFAYLNHLRDNGNNGEVPYDPDFTASIDDQIEKLHDKERQRAIKHCLDKWKPQNRRVIEQLFRYPDISTKTASEELGIKYSTYRVKKQRLLDRLQKCVQQLLDY